MPSTKFVYRVLTLGILACVCSSAGTAAIGIDRETPDATTGCFPGVNSVDRGETVGDVVDVEMLLCFSGSVTVDGPGYHGKATLGDGSRSGAVTLHLNTGAADSAVFDVTSDTLDSVPVNATGDGSFGSGTYTVTVRDGSGDVVDAASFELNESSSRTNASREAVAVYSMANGSFGSGQAIEDALSDGTLEPAGDVAFGDTLAVAIDSERLVERIHSTNGSSTAGFFAALDSDAEFRIVQTNPTPMANRKVALLGPENVTVHTTEGTVYAVIETRNVTFEYREVHRQTDLYGGERFAVRFGYNLSEDWDRGSVPSSPIIEFHPQSELTTEASSTTGQLPTTEASPTTKALLTTTRRTSDPPSSENSPTPVQSTTGTDTEVNDAGTTGVPGFTVLTALVALLVLVVNRVRRT